MTRWKHPEYPALPRTPEEVREEIAKFEPFEVFSLGETAIRELYDADPVAWEWYCILGMGTTRARAGVSCGYELLGIKKVMEDGA